MILLGFSIMVYLLVNDFVKLVTESAAEFATVPNLIITEIVLLTMWYVQKR